MAGNKPTPEYEVQNNLKDRALQVSRDNDTVETITIGVKDIDESIFYYFNNVLKPQVTQNSSVINVPLIYASPERWAAMQKDGYYRDKNGKMQAPLITFKRTNLEKNRNLGNKLDGNNPQNFGIFTKQYSRKNAYDRFGTLNNRVKDKEMYAVALLTTWNRTTR
jgi:hypothetical protein